MKGQFFITFEEMNSRIAGKNINLPAIVLEIAKAFPFFVSSFDFIRIHKNFPQEGSFEYQKRTKEYIYTFDYGPWNGAPYQTDDGCDPKDVGSCQFLMFSRSPVGTTAKFSKIYHLHNKKSVSDLVTDLDNETETIMQKIPSVLREGHYSNS